jgi:thiosulfate dehydrogenase
MARKTALVLLGFVLALVVVAVGSYIFIASGGVPMAATSKPLPLEETVAKLALRANYKHAIDLKSPLPLNDDTLKGGADVYNGNCALCHGALDQPKPDIAANMFPPPPQLLRPGEMVTDDPEGVTYWKITNGIRLSGMPAFQKIIDDKRRWQVTLLLTHADNLSPAVKKQLLGPE